MSDAIFIVGYYRSGTSALSGTLEKAGVKFYNDADANEHNPLGFYEIPELIQLDVDLFNRLGVDWTDVRSLPAGWAERPDMASFTARLDEILRRRFPPRERLWGLKHPHLCRTLPLYERAARQAGHSPHVVHIFRDPWAAASSQARKNGLTRAHALLLWLSYATDAERQARHLPRSWLTYQELLADPQAQLRRIGAELGLTFKRDLTAACAHLNGQLNRSENLPSEGLSQPLRRLVEATWAAIQARHFDPGLWDELAEETADLVGFLSEIGASRARALPAFGGTAMAAEAPRDAAAMPRPSERTDEAAKARLLALQNQVGALPRLTVLLAAPAGQAPAVTQSLESLRAQWAPPALIKVLAADALSLPGIETIPVADAPEAMTRALCAALNDAAQSADYVAILNAGDMITPDGCLRMALLAAQSQADLLYSDEIVPRAEGAWIRQKPGWDVTRLRQAAYLGDWVWYKAEALRAAGGFDERRAGAEEYDVQLRFASRGARVERLPEAIFIRQPGARRDDIAPQIFCARAAEALSAHLAGAGQPAEVQNRQHMGLFHHVRLTQDPGTSLIMLCDGVEIPRLDQWMTGLFSGPALSGPVILVATEHESPVGTYLGEVARRGAELQGQVLASLADSPGAALAQALALAPTALVAVLDARMLEITPHWLEGLRARLADPGVAAVAARMITPTSADGRQGEVLGPIVIGADARLGAGHGVMDPGPGGWLLVDQEASAIAPPGLLARRAALAACHVETGLEGDALWIDLCAQLRAAGHRLVWTPDVSLVMPAGTQMPDATHRFRAGGAAARALPWADPYHHPALSLHGDLLAAELQTGLVRASPADPASLLLTGEPAEPALNAARALRHTGLLDADWAPGLPGAADLGRRGTQSWVRINPQQPPHPYSPGYTALYTALPAPEAQPALAAAQEIYATSPQLAAHLRQLAPASIPVTLWRPALSRRFWRNFESGTGLNTNPRVLWIDEGIAPLWMQELIEATLEEISWVIVERPDHPYPKAFARLGAQANEQSWAQALATVGPQIMLRPVASETHHDHYPLLLGAAAGCRLLVDRRLDIPETLGAQALPNRKADWLTALRAAMRDLPGTLRAGAKARAAALALPALEDAPPGWAAPAMARLADTAEQAA